MKNSNDIEKVELNDKEKDLLPYFVSGLKTRVGKGNAVKAAQIMRGISQRSGIYVTNSNVCRIINYIRMNGLVKNLLANSKGYYVENDKEEIKRYIKTLEDRAMALQTVADKLKQSNFII